MTHPLAGKPAPRELLVDLELLRRRYFDKPDPADPQQRVSFGTSGHRGSSLRGSFNEAHILAVTQAVCEYRKAQGTTGPLFLGADTHALPEPAQHTALQVLAANEVEVLHAPEGEWTPTPVISHAILVHNRGRTAGLADGIVITPSHNPPEDGGIKYNPPSGGPADTSATGWIERRANELLTAQVRRAEASRASTLHEHDFVAPYVKDLRNVVDLEAVRAPRPRLAVDPLGGSNVAYWRPIAEEYGLDLTVVNERVDPTFSFMPLDHDGKIRMDCSSPYAMANLVALKDRYDLAFGNDTDSDRHGIVTPGQGLLNPNHYLTAAIGYLFRNRPGWRANWDASCARSRWASSGSWTGCSTARSDSGARRARARRSSAATGRCGRPTRTASSWTCSPPRCWRGPARIQASKLAPSCSGSGRPTTRASTRPRRRSRNPS